MRLIRVILVAVLLTACIPASSDESADSYTEDRVYKYHDAESDVTCWVFYAGYAGGISCLPDSQLRAGGESGEE